MPNQACSQLRKAPSLYNCQYTSPFPLQKIENHGSTSIKLVDQHVEVQPNETYIFNGPPIFQLNLEYTELPKGEVIISGICAWSLFPSLSHGNNQLHLGLEKNPSTVCWSYEIDETLECADRPTVHVLNQKQVFDYCSPTFDLGHSLNQPEAICWQISSDSNFQLVPSNFDQVESFTSTVTLPLISETFFNPQDTYYFRVKGFQHGQWGEWSAPYAFTVNKPLAVERVLFDPIDDDLYELNWERWAEESDQPIEYLVFGSNALDFIPSIYCDKQVNAIVNGIVVEEEVNDNLIAITTEPKITVNGNLAYYRIIARQKGQLSVPSPMIHVYDDDLIQPRNVLQLVDKDPSHTVAKRVIIPSFSGKETSLPHVHASFYENSLINIYSALRAIKLPEKKIYPYELPAVPQNVWEVVKPYLLPDGHPAWPKLHRIFCKQRATLNHETFKKAGFKRWRPGRWSRVSASSHPDLKEYFIKAYCDCEIGIVYDWKRWIHRIGGTKAVRDCIKKYQLQSKFKVIRKWIYPLPAHPSTPHSSRYLRKNFILVCENVRPLEHSKNDKRYKKMNKEWMDALYIILQANGLYDSVFPFNVPFCKDGRMAVVDTEYWGKWPVPFDRLTRCFSKEMQNYWRKITFNEGHIPRGTPQHNMPRNDRRDIIPKKPQP